MKRFLKLMAISLVSILCLGCCGCFGFFPNCNEPEKSEEESIREYITRATSIEVPTDSTMVYLFLAESSGFMHGRDGRYVVFQFEEMPIEWLNENNIIQDDGTFTNWFNPGFESLQYDLQEANEEIPQEYLANFEEEYLCLRAKKSIYFYYNITTKLLIILVPGY